MSRIADLNYQRNIPHHRIPCPVYKLGGVTGKGSKSNFQDGLDIGQWGMSNSIVVHHLSSLDFLSLFLSLLLLVLLLLYYYDDFTLFQLLNCLYLNP